MIIAISGKSGAGKTSVAQKVAQMMGLRVVSLSFKEMAQKEKMPLMDFQKKAGQDKRIDIDLDNQIRSEAKKGNCVVATWLGPWIVDGADLRVWLDASDKVRAERIAGRDGLSSKEAITHIKKRDADNRARYKALYGIDIEDRSIFDMQIDAGKYSIEEIAKMIVDGFEKRKIQK